MFAGQWGPWGGKVSGLRLGTTGISFDFASADEYRAGIERAIENGWLVRHESGTFVKFTQAGADLFA
jgi:hypothetical protein